MKSRYDKSLEYTAEKIDEEYMGTIIVKASEKAKELEEVSLDEEEFEDDDTNNCDPRESAEESCEVGDASELPAEESELSSVSGVSEISAPSSTDED